MIGLLVAAVVCLAVYFLSGVPSRMVAEAHPERWSTWKQVLGIVLIFGHFLCAGVAIVCTALAVILALVTR